MDHGLPDDHTVRAALALAGWAPSVKNTPPWRWRIADRSVHLYPDPTRALSSTDPYRRGLVTSSTFSIRGASSPLLRLRPWSPNPLLWVSDRLEAEFAARGPTVAWLLQRGTVWLLRRRYRAQWDRQWRTLDRPTTEDGQ